ncbi:hypothetical protein NKF26_12145 [Haladaptatus sp. AB618]|uniref:hypothetical protein n=1 Tax=Haladaptatus sp. AB618 TaxID=2934173 RepID=UPI00209C1CDC|nr:hypothetical protein [Haladaptatus sp. AB618]MCO8254554.1 hypothetical protein [Haladaptatus sp. AB618]
MSLAPLLIGDVVRFILDTIGAAGVPVALVVTLVSVAYYSRHALAAGALFGSLIRIASVASVVIAVLLATNVVDVNFDAAVTLVDGIRSLVSALTLV